MTGATSLRMNRMTVSRAARISSDIKSSVISLTVLSKHMETASIPPCTRRVYTLRLRQDSPPLVAPHATVYVENLGSYKTRRPAREEQARLSDFIGRAHPPHGNEATQTLRELCRHRRGDRARRNRIHRDPVGRQLARKIEREG